MIFSFRKDGMFPFFFSLISAYWKRINEIKIEWFTIEDFNKDDDDENLPIRPISGRF